jgi:hypothetical protein
LARGLPCERFTAALASRTSCITRGRGGWLNLPRGGLAPPILCQLPGALREGVRHGSGGVFLPAQNEIQDPAKLKRLVGLIDSEVWLGLPVDVKGNIYEGLLARNAEDVKSGAGQYFTPRPLIEAMVQVVDPKPHQTIHDPACGTAGFLLAAWEHMKQHPKARDRGVYSALKNKFSGVDIVPEVVRLAAMNLYLHGITGDDSIVEAKDALLGAGGKTYDVISPIRLSARSRAIALSATTARSTANVRISTGRIFSSPPRTNN